MLIFLKEHSYEAVKMVVTQIAISIFGLVLSLACNLAENNTLGLFCSCFAVLFYLFLLYTSVWEIGSKHQIPVQYGHRKNQPLLGLYISLLANSINILMAIFFTIGTFFPSVVFFHDLGVFGGNIAIATQAMYAEILTIQVGAAAAPLNTLWFMYFLIPIPALITCTVGYYFGLKHIKFTKFFDAKPADGEQKKDK
jgi:hypothetical protein